MLYLIDYFLSDGAIPDDNGERAVRVAEPIVPVPASREAKDVVTESQLRKGLLVDFDYAMLTDGETFTFKGTVSAHTFHDLRQ